MASVQRRDGPIMTRQQAANRLLSAWWANDRDLPAALLECAIEDALNVAANSNDIAPADALYHAQQQAVANVMGGL